MPFLKNISKKVSGAAKSAAKKSEDLVEITKLKRDLSVEEEKKKEIYLNIGRAVFDKFKNGKNLDDDLMGLCKQIAEIDNNIDAIKKNILKIRNMNVCPRCRNEVGQDVIFCPRCGCRIGNKPAEKIKSQDLHDQKSLEK